MVRDIHVCMGGLPWELSSFYHIGYVRNGVRSDSGVRGGSIVSVKQIMSSILSFSKQRLTHTYSLYDLSASEVLLLRMTGFLFKV